MCLLLSSHFSYERNRNTMAILFEFIHEGGMYVYAYCVF